MNAATKERMPGALRAATDGVKLSNARVTVDAYRCTMVLRITTAYEQGFGHAARLELRNPYAPGSLESLGWEQGREVGRQRIKPQPTESALRSMNADLCGFAMRWKSDGDYLRCAKCKRPHIASKADMAFAHAAGCKADGKVSAHPWRELIEILRPLIDTPAPGANA